MFSFGDVIDALSMSIYFSGLNRWKMVCGGVCACVCQRSRPQLRSESLMDFKNYVVENVEKERRFFFFIFDQNFTKS